MRAVAREGRSGAGDFNDVTVGVQAGRQYAWGRSRLACSFGPAGRWYGRDPYSRAVGGSVSWQRPTGKRSQMRIEGGIVHQTNLRNVLQTADDFTLSASFDRAFNARTGGGVQLYGSREAARSEEHTSEHKTLMRISYAVCCL